MSRLTAEPVDAAVPARVNPTAQGLRLPALAALVPGGFVAALGLGQGGYFPPAWGWSALGFCWVVGLKTVMRPASDARRLDLLFVGLLAAFTAWVTLSLTWSADVPGTVFEVERGLVFVTGAAALVLLARRRSVSDVLGGLLVAIAGVCTYALATRLFPERIGSYDSVAVYRLAEPVGYWNALGVLAAIGALLAVGFVARGRSTAFRALAGTSLVVLAPTMYFTFSRGAWVALAVGLGAALALDPRRLQLAASVLVVSPAPVLAVWLGSRSDALTRVHAPLAEAARQGHRLAWQVIIIAAAGAGLTLALVALERRVTISRRVRIGYGVVLVVGLASLITSTVVHYGGPVSSVRKAYSSFTAPPAQYTRLGKRLFTFSSNGRVDLWHTAWRDWERHRLLGSGAGTYEQVWLRDRKSQQKVRDAHSLYVETLAELGLPGLALLVAALCVPLPAALLARRRPLVPAAFGAYAGYVVHAGVDWDWEVPALTLAAFACAVALLAAARKGGDRRLPATWVRAVALGASGVVAMVALAGLAGNSTIAAGNRALDRNEWAKSVTEARRAKRLAPWSPDPWRILGQAQLGLGDRAGARASFLTAIGKERRNWELWLWLGLASDGSARERALRVATRLNPLSPELRAVRSVEGPHA